jgi:prepilin-type N-terminal cleavage/methylation domain-containing protein
MRTSRLAGFTLIELLLVVGMIVVLAAIAMPLLLRAKQAGNQSSAVASLRTIVSAQYAYSSACGWGFFAPALSTLGRAPAGGASFISEDLGQADVVTKSAYAVTMGSSLGAAAESLASCNGQAAGTSTKGYWATATPSENAGSYAYGTNATGAIFKAEQLVPVAMTDTTAPAYARPLDK